MRLSANQKILLYICIVILFTMFCSANVYMNRLNNNTKVVNNDQVIIYLDN